MAVPNTCALDLRSENMHGEWGRVSVKELGKRLHRDPSVISRLYSAYVAAREKKLRRRCFSN